MMILMKGMYHICHASGTELILTDVENTTQNPQMLYTFLFVKSVQISI